MKTSHAVAIGVSALAVAGGGYAYFYSKSKKRGAPGYYPGAQGIPGRAPNGAPQAYSGVPIGGKGNDAAQIIGASAPIAIGLLPYINEWFSGSGGEDPATAGDPVASTEGISPVDADPLFFT